VAGLHRAICGQCRLQTDTIEHPLTAHLEPPGPTMTGWPPDARARASREGTHGQEGIGREGGPRHPAEDPTAVPTWTASGNVDVAERPKGPSALALPCLPGLFES